MTEICFFYIKSVLTSGSGELSSFHSAIYYWITRENAADDRDGLAATVNKR